MRLHRSLRFVLLLAVCSSAFSAEKRGFRPEDVYLLQSLADPQVSPDGKLVAYTVTRVDKAKNRRVSSVWLVPTDGSAAPRELKGAHAGRAARWTPDGRMVAFIASSVEPADAPAVKPDPTAKPDPAAGKAQVYAVAPDGSAAPAKLTNFKDGVSRFSWSPDGTKLACVVKSAEDDAPRNSDTKHYSSMIYKFDGQGWSDGKHNHIWIVDAKSGKSTQLTSGANRDDNDPQWSPDGKWVSYSSSDSSPSLRETMGVGNVFITAADGSGTPRSLADGRAYLQDPRWSPDGKWIAFAAAPTPDEQPQLWLTPSAGGAAKLATEVDLFPSGISWSDDGDLFFSALERGTQHVFRVDIAHGRSALVVAGNRSVGNLEVADRTHRLVFSATDSQHPIELYSADFDGKNEKQLTHINQQYLDEVALSQATEFTWKSADDLTIEGWLVKPLNFQPGKKYPLVLSIHGGPNGMWGYQYASDAQLFAANGWAVLMANPRGSSGYGMKFQRAVAGEWGGKAVQDLLKGVETALANNPWLDKDRIGVTGVSYGGFMSDWIVTQTKIFKAAVPIAGISNLISVEGTRDGAYGHSRDFGGDLWEGFDNYWKYSAVRLARNVDTPVLFLHGEADNRVPPSQAEEYFRALKHFGKTAEIVLFPREAHSPGGYEPKHLVESFQWRQYWFDKYLNGNTQAVAPDMRRPVKEANEVAAKEN